MTMPKKDNDATNVDAFDVFTVPVNELDIPPNYGVFPPMVADNVAVTMEDKTSGTVADKDYWRRLVVRFTITDDTGVGLLMEKDKEGNEVKPPVSGDVTELAYTVGRSNKETGAVDNHWAKSGGYFWNDFKGCFPEHDDDESLLPIIQQMTDEDAEPMLVTGRFTVSVSKDKLDPTKIYENQRVKDLVLSE